MTAKAAEEYDEEGEMIHYVLNFYSIHMTASECRLIKAIYIDQQVALSGKVVSTAMSRGWGLCDVEKAYLLDHGSEGCRRNIRDRLLRDGDRQFEVNRCPRCRRIARTSKARQCFWCGHDWH